jgi:hypothetical protein
MITTEQIREAIYGHLPPTVRAEEEPKFDAWLATECTKAWANGYAEYQLRMRPMTALKEIQSAIAQLMMLRETSTIDAQLAILRHTANFCSGDLDTGVNRHVVELARVINERAEQS